jgi:hypothetical protein
VLRKFLDDRNDESARLPAACARHRNHIEALKDHRDSLPLDGGWQVVSFGLNGLEQALGQVVRLEAATASLILFVFTH